MQKKESDVTEAKVASTGEVASIDGGSLEWLSASQKEGGRRQTIYWIRTLYAQINVRTDMMEGRLQRLLTCERGHHGGVTVT